jgi:Tol biopolymer transport system component
MTESNKEYGNHTLKRIILFLVVIILINPVVLYLVSGNIIFSILIPLLSVAVILLLNESKKTKPLSVLVFNLLLVLSFFLHAEAIFTTNFSDYIIEDLYEVKQKYYFNRPLLNKTFRDKEFIVQYKTNKQGFRIGSEDEPEIEVEKIDWLFLGDSYTQGAQVQYEDLYTSKLFNFFPDKIIANAGISGMGLPEEYNYYINEGKTFKPKKVILQVCNFNDFMNVKERQSGFSDYLMHYSNFARFLLYGFKYANPAELPLGRWTEPFYPNEKANEDYNIFYKSSSEIKKQDILNFEAYLKKLNEVVVKNGAELVVVQIPTKEQVYYKFFEEVITNFKIDASKLDMNLPNKFLDRICKENGIKHLDLLNDFTDSEQQLFYQFDEHLNVQGHEQMAKSISNFLSNDTAKHLQPKLLSIFNTGDRYPNFSMNDCNVLSFQSFRDGNMELFLADSLLQSQKRLTWNSIDEIHPWLSSDNIKIVFTEGNQADNKTKVGIMNIDGSERKYITAEKNTFGAIPAFSYGDSKITYAEWKQNDKSGNFSNSYIVTYDLTTNKKDIITSDKFESWRPIFSPDNKRLFYISKEVNEKFDVFVYDLATGEKKNLTNTIYDEWDAAISRDGNYLVYAGKKNGNWDLFLQELSTAKTEQLTTSLGDEWDPTFSPCGNSIYFAGTFGFRNGIFRIDLKK